MVWVMPVPPNEGMKLTRPERIGALQLIPGVRPTSGWTRRRPQRILKLRIPACEASTSS
jgi:hypothetical protein